MHLHIRTKATIRRVAAGTIALTLVASAAVALTRSAADDAADTSKATALGGDAYAPARVDRGTPPLEIALPPELRASPHHGVDADLAHTPATAARANTTARVDATSRPDAATGPQLPADRPGPATGTPKAVDNHESPTTANSPKTAASPKTGGNGGPQHDPEAFAPHEMLVRFDPSTSEADRERVRRRHGMTKIEDLPLAGLERVRVANAAPTGEAATVSDEPAVRYAQPNYVWQVAAAPDDPAYRYQWGSENDGILFGGVADADGDVTEGYARAADTSGVVVAVIDEGVDTTHADLADNMWVNPGEIAGNGVDDDANGYIDDIYGWDFVDETASVYDGLGDDHGTHVAGTIAATSNNGLGGAGVSQAKIMALKFLGPGGGLTSDAIEAIDYAVANGAHVTNNSWGGTGADRALGEKIQAAGEAGLLFVAAAGNDTVDNDATPHYPSSFKNPYVLSVAATDSGDGLASFSNWGATSVDVGAPGDTILSTVPGRNTKAVLSSYQLGKAALHTFGLEGVVDAADRAAVIDAALSDWAGVASGGSVLVVDDDWGYPFQPAYAQALADAGYTSVTTSPPVGDCVDGPSVTGKAAVVWITGPDYRCTLTANDQAALTTYVDGGGVLLLFGQSIAEDLAGSTFMSSVLKASFTAYTDHDYGLVGVSTSPYSAVDLRLTGTGNERQSWSNAVEPLTGGTSAIKGTGPNDYMSGTSMATPFVTGIVANLLAKFPGMRATHIKDRIMETGDAAGELATTTVSGKRVNLDNALASGTLSGTVTADAGGNLAGICVTAWSDPTGSYSETTTTDANGAYSLTLPTDAYTVQFRDCSASPAYGAEWNLGAADWSNAVPVTVSSGGTTTVDAALAAGGSISGTVVESATSTALSGVCVYAFTSSGTWVGSTRTPSDGMWTIGGLGAGSYQVRFTDCTRTGAAQYATHWYDSSADHATGYTLVAVTAGAATLDIDASLPLSGQITGKVTNAGGAGLGYICVTATTPGDGGIFIQRVKTDSTGSYTVGGMGSGNFKLYFKDCSGLGYTAEWWQDSATFSGASTIAVNPSVATTIANAVIG